MNELIKDSPGQLLAHLARTGLLELMVPPFPCPLLVSLALMLRGDHAVRICLFLPAHQDRFLLNFLQS